MAKSYLLKIYLSIISLCLWSFSSIAQNYNVTTTVQCSPQTGGTETVSFTAVTPNAIGDATLTLYYNGDLSTSEYIEFFGESSSTTPLGTATNGSSQCGANYDSMTLTIPMADINTWAADGTIDIVADAASSVNNICSGNSFCVYMRLEYPRASGLNDIGVASIDTPTVFCAGSQNIWVTVKNYGINQINNFTVNWTWNGVAQTPLSITQLLDTAQGSNPSNLQVMLGTKTITDEDTIVVWTSNPNSSADTTNMNDTITQVFGPSLMGAFTINAGLAAGGGNYQSFTALVNDLAQYGICGPVTVNVTGTYNEQVVIPQIAGSSATNTITINGSGDTLTSSGSSSNYATLNLDGADYITFKNLVIEASSTTSNFAVHLMNDADHNTFDSCVIMVNPAATSSTTGAVSMSGSVTSYSTAGNNGSHNTFSNSTITGGYFGLAFYGSSAASNVNNSIINCTVKDFYVYGSYNVQQSGATISNNIFERPTRATVSTFYGIMLSTGCNNMLVEKNNIRNAGGASGTAGFTAYCIYNSGAASSGNENKIYNNIIHNIGNTSGTTAGLYMPSGTYVQAYHNTIVLNTASATSGTVYGIYTTGSSVDIKNNNIYIAQGGSGTKYGLYFSGSGKTSDNNNIYLNAPAGVNNTGYYSGAYATLAAWQGANGGIWDQNSVEVNPFFVSIATGNLTPTNSLLDDIGTPVGITTDFSGAARSLTTPDIGAFEFSVPPCSGTPIPGTAAAVNNISSVCLNGLVDLTLTGFSLGSGISIQWEESPAGAGFWTPIAGATTGLLTDTLTAPTDYRAMVTCANGGGSDVSNTVTMSISPFYLCYCSPLTGVQLQTSSGTNYMTNVSIPSTTLNSTTSAVGTGGYLQLPYTTSSNTATLAQGVSYTLEVTTSTSSANSEAWIDWDMSGTFDSSEYITLSVGGTLKTGTILIPTTAMTGLTGLRVRNVYSSTTFHGPTGACSSISLARETEDYVITIAPAPSCLPPSVPTATAITAATGVFEWNTSTSNPANGYEWSVFTAGNGPTGTPVASGTEAAGDTIANVTGLSALTNYTFFVRALCGGSNSLWMSVNFTTPCAALVAPWYDSVESQNANTNSTMTNCWSSDPTGTTSLYRWNVDASGSTPSASTGPSGAFSGSKYFYVEASNGSTNDIASLYTPQIDVSSLTSPMLEFYYHMYGAGINKLVISVHNGTTWNNVDSIMGQQQTSLNDPWLKKSIFLTGYTGTIQVKFEAHRGTALTGDISLDDIAVIEAPTCPNPTSPTATNITLTSADLGWTSNSSATQYQIEYGQGTSFALGTGTRVGPTGVANPYTLGGLTAATQYSFFVREICGPGDTSTWSARTSFMTLFPVPPNDECSTAIDISNGNVVNGYVNNATQSMSACDATNPANDVWYKFTTGSSATTVTINVNTTNTGTDVVMQAFSGTCGTLTPMIPTASTTLGSNGCIDGPAAGLEYGTYTVAPNTTYYVRIYGYNTAQGTFPIQIITPPVNDDICNATTLVIDDPVPSCVNTSAATVGPNDPAVNSCSSNNNTVWYKFTPTASQAHYLIATVPINSLDPLSAWLFTYTASGTCPGTLTLTPAGGIGVTCQSNTGTAGSTTSFTTSVLTANTTYYLFVDGNSSDVGDICFQVLSFPLAIKITDINAVNQGNRNRVNWVTGEEQKGDYFELERSEDGTNFSKLATLNAKGEASTYTYIDERPVSGTNYYRLKMYDASGKSEYSKVVTATMKGKAGFNVEAYPNPVGNGQLSVVASGTDARNATVMITDITGKVIRTVTMTNGIVQINMNGMAQGIYLVKYTDDVNTTTIKLYKK